MPVNTLLRIEGIDCQHCGERVESALRRVPGVLDTQMDWRSGRCRIEHEGTVGAKGLTRVIALSANGTAHRYRAEPVPGDKRVRRRGHGGALFPLLLLALCLPCAAAAIGLSSLAAIFASKWIGVVPALALAAVFGLGTWWLLRRRRKVCATCLEAGSERANP